MKHVDYFVVILIAVICGEELPSKIILVTRDLN